MNLIQLAALAGAGFFAWRYVSSTLSSPSTTTPPSTSAPPATTVPPIGGASATPPPSTTPISTAPTSVTPAVAAATSTRYASDPEYAEQLRRTAAAGESDSVALADSIGVRFNIDQWNWYREASGGAPVDSNLMPVLIGGLDRSTPILASEYRARLRGAGLSGLGFYNSYWG